METVIIVIHLMVIVALVAVVLLQRSEGGALGIGGQNAFLSGRAQGNVLTRSTAILAAVFFATSIGLALISRLAEKPSSILDTVPVTSAPVVPATPATPATPAVPAVTPPATVAPTGTNVPVTPTVPATPAPVGPQVPTSQ
jgi:preprotein translocase subunit SecG